MFPQTLHDSATRLQLVVQHYNSITQQLTDTTRMLFQNKLEMIEEVSGPAKPNSVYPMYMVTMRYLKYFKYQWFLFSMQFNTVTVQINSYCSAL